MRTHGIQMAAWLAVAAVALGPSLWTDLNTVPGGVWTDSWNSLWSMHFASDSIAHGRLPWVTDALNHPDGGTVLLPDFWGSVFAVLSVPLLGLAPAYTAWIVLQLALSGWVMQRFAEAWLSESLEPAAAARAGWVAGLGYATAPVLLAGAACGTSEAVAGAPPVLAVWATWQALSNPSRRATVLAGLAFVVAGLASWYAAVIAAVFSAVLTAHRVPALGARALGPLATGLAMLLPVALWTHGIHSDVEHLATRDPAILDSIRASFGAASPLGMVWPVDTADIAVQHRDDMGQGYLHTGYIGLSLLTGTALMAFKHSRRTAPWLIAGGICALLALGPGSGGMRPYALVDDLPGFRNLSLVWRLAGGMSIAAALLAAAATRGNRKACGVLVALIAIESAAFAPTAGGVAASDAGPSAVLSALSAEPEGAVVTIPASAAHADLWRQSQHGQPITSTINQRYSATATEWISSAAKQDWNALQDNAQKLGIRYVLMHQSRNLRASDDRFLARILQDNGRIVQQEGRWTAYAVW